MSEADPKRRLLLVDKPLQMKIVSFSVLHAVIAVSVTAAIAVQPLLHAMLKSNDISVQFYSGMAFLSFCQRLLPLSAVLLLAFTFHLLLVTSRIFGPLARFRAMFKRVGEGDLGETIAIRKRDYLQRECASVNEMIEALSDRLGQVTKEHAALAAALASLDPQGEAPRAAVLEARADAGRVAELLAAFRLRSRPAGDSERR